LADSRDERGRRLVVRNGYAQPREVMTAAGAAEVRAPRVNDKRVDAQTGERKRFRSVILPPWCRKSPKVAEVLPLLYLHGLSTGDFVPALESSLGSAAGLSAASIARLSKQWTDDYHAFCQRDLSGVDYVYVWVGGIHVRVRLEEDKLCLLVIVGVRADGTKELVALADGYRESTGSWADLLPECARRGMRAPVLAVGDGALGFWAALAEIYNAEDKRHAHAAAKAFANAYGAKFSRATAKITDDLDVLLTFYDYPAEHWITTHVQPDRVHLRHGAPPHPGHQRTGQPRRRTGHGVQAHRVRPTPNNAGEQSTHRTWSPWSAPVPPSLPQRAARRTPNRPGRRMTADDNRPQRLPAS
jgi:transposase-like protein